MRMSDFEKVCDAPDMGGLIWESLSAALEPLERCIRVLESRRTGEDVSGPIDEASGRIGGSSGRLDRSVRVAKPGQPEFFPRKVSKVQLGD